jgi:hypothetical protein
MISGIAPLAQAVQRQTSDLVNEMHSLTLARDWNDDALGILVTTLFKSIECESKLANETLCSRIANNAGDLFANSCLYVCESWR